MQKFGWWSLALIGSLMIGATTPLLAQEAAPPLTLSGDNLVLQAMDHSLSMPLPGWLAPEQLPAGEIGAAVPSRYDVEEDGVRLALYPEGEGQESWTQLYGARIARNDGRHLASYRNQVVETYGQRCKREVTGFFQLGEDNGEQLAPLGFVCGAFHDGLAGFAGQGEVMVMTFRKTDAGVASVYQEWRGEAFDPADPASWPVATEVVQARAELLQAQTQLAQDN